MFMKKKMKKSSKKVPTKKKSSKKVPTKKKMTQTEAIIARG